MSLYNEHSPSKLVIKAHLRIKFTIRLVEYFQIWQNLLQNAPLIHSPLNGLLMKIYFVGHFSINNSLMKCPIVEAYI